MAHIVVLGAGVGGVPMAYELLGVIRKQTDTITVISDRDSFHFTPSHPWVAVGWRESQNISIPLQPLFDKLGIKFIHSGLQHLDPSQNQMTLENGQLIKYDCLVIATGPKLNFESIEGFGPDGYTHSVCALRHAEKAFDEWQKFVENPGPIVVGAVQGASCYGPAYEYACILDTELKRRRIRHKVPITFVTAEPYIGHLGLGGVGNTKGILEAEMRDRHINWITNAHVERIEPDKMFVTEYDYLGNESRHHELPFKYSALIPSFRGIDPLRDIEGLVDKNGFVIIDEFQRNPKFDNIFAVGVCISIKPIEETPIPTGVPKTGYMIESMVKAAAENIRALLHGKSADHRATWNAFCLADLGNKGIAFIAIPQNPPRNTNWASEGRWVHLAKIAFEKYFLRKVRKGQMEPFYEKAALGFIRLNKLKPKKKKI